MVDCELTVVFNIGGAVEKSDEKDDTIMPTHGLFFFFAFCF